MSYMNPYNFVPLREMDADARQTPVWHSQYQQGLHSGSFSGYIIALSPIFILPTDTGDEESILRIPLPPCNDGGKHIARQGKSHTVYWEFFHRGDKKPVIPGTTLKGVVRSVAEAAANSCLSVFAENFKPAKKNKLASPRYAEPFDLAKHITKLHLQPCSHIIHEPGNIDTGLCPTCRLFGMPSASEGTSDTGELPDFFAGKVTFHDAHLVGEAEYDALKPLVELSSPDPTSYLYYTDWEERIPRGRKFYYHQPEVRLDDYASRALDLLEAYQSHGPNSPKFRSEVEGNDGLDRKVTVRPLKKSSVFKFQVDYQNLTDEELNLLIFAMELDARRPIEKASPGAYHKIGYGKPAGLGSAKIVIETWRLLNLERRYQDEGSGWTRVIENRLEERIMRHKKAFFDSHVNANLVSLRKHILAWPNKGMTFHYPVLTEFKAEGGYQLPKPGREPKPKTP